MVPIIFKVSVKNSHLLYFILQLSWQYKTKSTEVLFGKCILKDILKCIFKKKKAFWKRTSYLPPPPSWGGGEWESCPELEACQHVKCCQQRLWKSAGCKCMITVAKQPKHLPFLAQLASNQLIDSLAASINWKVTCFLPSREEGF